jgi:putative ABC transport system permease protein
MPLKDKNITPPKRLSDFLKGIIKQEYAEDILGDLAEEYAFRIEESSVFGTKLWYAKESLLLIRPSLLKSFSNHDSYNNSDMISNYILIAWRNMRKYKMSTAINLFGLSISIAAFIIIALFVKDEISYDRHHEKADRIFRVTVKNFEGDGKTLSRQWAFASSGHSPRLKQDFPQVEHAIRFFPWAFPDITVGDKKFNGEQVAFADKSVFDIFTFDFIMGQPSTAFVNENSLVLTESMAVKLFGNDWQNQNLLGQIVKFEVGPNSGGMSISAIIKDMPPQQHFHFDYLAPFSLFEAQMNDATVTDNVSGNYNFLTYVLLGNPDDATAVEAGSADFFNKYVGETRGIPADQFYQFQLQPIKSIHLTSNLSGEIENNGSINQVIIFSIIGLLLLLIACINYMNLATSRFTRRMKEIGVRKSIGASQSSLVYQFMMESTIITFLSLPISIILVQLALPEVNSFMGKELALNVFRNLPIFLSLIALMVFVTVLAGLYPAFYLTKVNTIKALKGESTLKSSKFNFRSVLVTFQYAVTISIIFALVVVIQQMNYIFKADPGFDRNGIVQVGLTREFENKGELFKSELLRNPYIMDASYQSRVPTGNLLDNHNASIYISDSATNVSFRLPFITADDRFLSTFGISLVAGVDFNPNLKSDSAGQFIINGTASEMLGFPDHSDAIGQKMSYGQMTGHIIGVTQDFHFESVHTPIVPMIVVQTDRYLRSISIKVDPRHTSEALAHIKSTWATYDSKNAFDYTFIDESFARQYLQEQRLGTMFKVFAVLAVIIGCLGMLGMVSFIIERKTKEIGIRKVLGAKSPNLMWIITQPFLSLIVIASALALPFSFYFMDTWLDSFAYRSSISTFTFLLTIGIVFIITSSTIIYRVLGATNINPVAFLRSE